MELKRGRKGKSQCPCSQREQFPIGTAEEEKTERTSSSLQLYIRSSQSITILDRIKPYRFFTPSRTSLTTEKKPLQNRAIARLKSAWEWSWSSIRAYTGSIQRAPNQCELRLRDPRTADIRRLGSFRRGRAELDWPWLDRKCVADGGQGEGAFDSAADDLDEVAAAKVGGWDWVNELVGCLSHWVGRDRWGKSHKAQEGSEEGAWNMHCVFGGGGGGESEVWKEATTDDWEDETVDE